MSITSQMIKELREKTSVGMMDCKAALKEADGDMEKAVVILREKGLAMANKKADRSATEGRVSIAIANQNVVAVTINCETDFVGGNDQFIALGNQIAQAAAENGSTDIASLESVTIDGNTVANLISESVLKLGENISIGDVQQFNINGSAAQYVHSNGKTAALVTSSGSGDEETLKDISMHIVASAPAYLKRDEVPQSVLDEESGIIRKQMENSNKPAQVIDKIIEGKINKYYQENCLLEQSFVKDPDKKVGDLLSNGSEIEAFARFSLGEG